VGVFGEDSGRSCPNNLTVRLQKMRGRKSGNGPVNKKKKKQSFGRKIISVGSRPKDKKKNLGGGRLGQVETNIDPGGKKLAFFRRFSVGENWGKIMSAAGQYKKNWERKRRNKAVVPKQFLNCGFSGGKGTDWSSAVAGNNKQKLVWGLSRIWGRAVEEWKRALQGNKKRWALLFRKNEEKKSFDGRRDTWEKKKKKAQRKDPNSLPCKGNLEVRIRQ